MDTHIDTFIKAVKKSFHAGWWKELFYEKPENIGFKVTSYSLLIISLEEGEEEIANLPVFNDNYNYILFDHEFNKYLWGDSSVLTGKYEMTEGEMLPESLPHWKYAMLEMVKYSHPLDYISRRI